MVTTGLSGTSSLLNSNGLTRKVFPQGYAAPSEDVTDWEFVRNLFSTHPRDNWWDEEAC